MNKRIVNLYVEGGGEVNFLVQLFEKKFEKKFQKDKNNLKAEFNDARVKITIRSSGGISAKAITRLLNEEIKVNIEKGTEAYLILDADTPEHKPAGGYEARKSYLEQRQREVGIAFDFFLTPNNREDGDLETLLDGLISEDGKDFYTCLKAYTYCLSKIDAAKIPPRFKKSGFAKIRLGWYVYGMSEDEQKTKQTERYYTQFWNLDAEALNPLVNFLRDILEKQTE